MRESRRVVWLLWLAAGLAVILGVVLIADSHSGVDLVINVIRGLIVIAIGLWLARLAVRLGRPRAS